MKFVGVEKVVRNLNKEISKIEGRCLSGLVSAGLMIRGESQKLTPVVTGNLRNSAYVVSSRAVEAAPKNGDSSVVGKQQECRRSYIPMVIVGYAASYAIFVHENPRAGKTGGMSPKGLAYKPSKGSRRIVYSTVGQWKFLEQVIMSNRKRVLAIIASKAKK